MISLLAWWLSGLAHAAEPVSFRIEASAAAQQEVKQELLEALGRLQAVDGSPLVPPEQVEFVDPDAPSDNARRRYWATQLDDARYVVGGELSAEQSQALDAAARRLRELDRRDAPRSPATHLLAIRLEADGKSLRLSHWRKGQDRAEAMSRTLPVDAAPDVLLSALVRMIPELDQPPRASLIVSQEAEGFRTRLQVDGDPGAYLPITPGVPVVFDAGGSHDPEQGLQGMEYRWSVDGRIVASTLEPRLSWTFEEPASPDEHVVEVQAIASGQPSPPARVTLAVAPRVALRDRTKTLWVLGTSSFPVDRYVRLWVEPLDGRADPAWRWRQIEGPALTCASIAANGVVSCEDMDRLTVFTDHGTLDIKPQRVGTYAFEVVQQAEGVPSRPVRASATAAYTRASLRSQLNGRMGVAYLWTNRSSQFGVAVEAGPPWLFGFRGRFGPIFAFDAAEQRPTAAGVQAGLAFDFLDLVSATADDPANPFAPRWRSSLARDISWDWRVEGVYQYQDPTDWADRNYGTLTVLEDGPKLPWEHTINITTGPVFQRRAFFVRVNGLSRYGLDEGQEIQLGLVTEVGVRDSVAVLPRGDANQPVFDAYERLHERRAEGRACVEVLPASLGPDTEALALSRNAGAIVRCESAERWAAHDPSRRALRRGQDRVRMWWGPQGAGTRVALLARGTTGERMVEHLQGHVRDGSLVAPVFGDRCAGEYRLVDPPAPASLDKLIDLVGKGERAMEGVTSGPTKALVISCPDKGDPERPASSVSVVARSFTRADPGDPAGLLVLDLVLPAGDDLTARQARWSMEPHRLMETLLPLLYDDVPAEAPPMPPLPSQEALP